MKSQENCSFFVSNAHLLTIILPYIDEKINEGKNVTILSQKDLNEDVKRYLKSVKKFDKEGIRKAFSKNKINYESLDEEGIAEIKDIRGHEILELVSSCGALFTI